MDEKETLLEKMARERGIEADSHEEAFFILICQECGGEEFNIYSNGVCCCHYCGEEHRLAPPEPEAEPRRRRRQ